MTLSSQVAALATRVGQAIKAVRADVAAKADTASLSSVATSGSYTDLTNKPTIPTVPVQSVAGKTGAVSLVKADVGLSNVDNTSDAAKPVSTATQTALSGKAALFHTHDLVDMSGTLSIEQGGTGATSVIAARTALQAAAATHTHTVAQVSGLATVATSGQYSDLTGTVPTAALPPLAINDTFAVSSQAQMLALVAQRGDMAIRSDINRTFVLADDSANLLSSWKEISAAGQVVSVAGRTGTVSLTKADVGLSNVDNTTDADKPVSTATAAALATKADSSSLATVATTGSYDDLKNKPAVTNSFDKGYDIILLIGQSNMSGAGDGYDANFDFSHSQVYSFGAVGTYANRIVQATETLQHWVPKQLPQIGPGIAFARSHAAKTSRKILLVPAAMGATGFTSGDKKWLTTWTPAHENLYELAIRQAKLALQAGGPGSKVTGFVWHQGEADSTSTGTAQYLTNITNLINGLRSRLSAPEAWFVLGQLNPGGNLLSASRQEIDRLQTNLPVSVYRTAFAYAPWQHNLDDTTHFNADGQRRLGTNLADAVNLAVANVPTSVPLPPTVYQTYSDVPGTITVRIDRPECRFTNFEVQTKIGSGEWTTVSQASSIKRDTTISGLVETTPVLVRARTINENGNSAYSAEVSMLPARSQRDITVANAWRGYSLRKIDPAYSGACIRVRRSSDSTSAEIGFTASGDLDEAALLAFCGTGDGFVSVWYNQTPTQNMSITNTGVLASQPLIVSAGKILRENGRPSMEFDGVDDYLFSANAGLGNTAFTVLLAFRDAGSTDATPRYWVESSTTDAIPTNGLSSTISTGTFTVQRRGADSNNLTSTSAAKTLDQTGRLQTILVTDSTTVTAFRGDRRKQDPQDRTRTAATLVLNTFTLGAYRRSNISNYAKMRISEAVFWQSALSDADQEAVVEHTREYWRMDTWY